MAESSRSANFNLSKLYKLRNKLISETFAPYIDARISGQVFHDLYEDVAAALPARAVTGAVFESLRCLAGCNFDRKTAAEWAWRLAGNIDALAAGSAVIPWIKQLIDERVPIRVERVIFDTKKDLQGFTFFCRVLAGSPCPLLFPQFLTRRSCAAIAREVGFTASWGKMPYSSGLYFSDLIFYAHVEADRSRETPYFRQISASPSMIKHNRRRIALRTRAEPCPQNFIHECRNCHIGYDKCLGGVYPKSLEPRECPNCGAVTFIEADAAPQICYDCANKTEA